MGIRKLLLTARSHQRDFGYGIFPPYDQDLKNPIVSDDAELPLQFLKVAQNPRTAEAGLLQRQFESDHLDTLGLDAFHHALNGGHSEIISQPEFHPHNDRAPV